jgi:hypothetical protein
MGKQWTRDQSDERGWQSVFNWIGINFFFQFSANKNRSEICAQNNRETTFLVYKCIKYEFTLATMREFFKECPSIMDFSEMALPHDMPSNVSGYYIKVYKVSRFLGWVLFVRTINYIFVSSSRGVEAEPLEPGILIDECATKGTITTRLALNALSHI